MRGTYTASSWIALAAASAAWAAPAFAQQTPQQPKQEPEVLSAQLGAPRANEVITVYADRVPDEPGAYSVIGQKDIQAVEANHPAEILNTVPGVNVQMNSGQELLVAIRSPVLPAGAGQGSFLILEDGVPTRASGFGNVNALFELHHETAEDIEVVRGPGSVRYGSNAVHGLINFIDPEPGAQTGSILMLSGNSLQRYRADATANFTVGGVANWAALSIMDDGGWRDASSVGQEKLTFRSKFEGMDWRAISTIAAVNLNQETAGFITGFESYKNDSIATTNPNPEAYRDAWAARANVRIEKNFGDNLLVVTPFAITQRMIFIQHFLPDQSTEKNGHDSFGVLSRFDFGPETMRWSLGADYQYASGYLKEIQTRASFGGPVSNPTFPKGIHYDYDVDTTMIGAYAELNWDFAPDWKLLAGVRAEQHKYDYVTHKAPGTYGRFRVAPDRKDEYNLLTPKLGVAWTAFGDNGILYANYARGERAPQTSDQYRLQNLQAIARLDVETLDSFEVGARGQLGQTHYDLAVYTMKKDHFFFRDSDGLNVPDGKTDHVGVEAEFNGDLLEAGGGVVSWNANVSWSDQTYAFNRNVAVNTEDIVDGARIDTAPEWLGDAGLGWDNGVFSLGASIEWVGEYFTDAANQHMYDGHTIGHLRGGWRFNDNFEAFGIIRNVTDERYADRADFATGTDRYFPGEPANVTVGVRMRN